MWNLTADDIQQAKEALMERRAAVQAHYDSEVSRLDAELADIEIVERFALNFASKHKEDAPSNQAVDPASAVRDAAPPINGVGEETAVEKSTDAEAAPAAAKNSSRWRMSLNGGEASL
jgi:hypothetical protein